MQAKRQANAYLTGKHIMRYQKQLQHNLTPIIMSKNLGSSYRRRASRMHVNPSNGSKPRRTTCKCGAWRIQLVPLFSGRGKKRIITAYKTISHRIDGLRRRDMLFS